MKIVLPLILLTFLALPLHAAENVTTIPATTTSTTTAARSLMAPIPLSTGWVEGFLLLIVWLFVAAILLGPLISFFRLEPVSNQRFSDDKRIRT